MEMNHEYASKGVAGAGLGTGIAGLSLGVINAMGGLAGMGGLFNSWNRPSAAQNDILTALLTADLVRSRSGIPCGSDCDPVTQREMRLTQQLAEKDSQIALRDANTFTDQKLLELYKYIDSRFTGVEAELAKQAIQNQATKDSFQLLQERLECSHKSLEAAIRTEGKERCCSDNTIINYLNATFYPQMVADVTTGSTTTAKKTYNPLPVCDYNCNSGC